MKFNNVLFKHLRKRFKYSQEQVGKACNVSQRTVSRWETGELEPSLEELNHISAMLNLDTYALIIINK